MTMTGDSDCDWEFQRVQGGDLIVKRNLAQEFLLKFPICLQINFNAGRNELTG